MNVGLSPSRFTGKEIDLLIAYGHEIERKFDTGRADDIQPPFIRTIIKTSVILRRKINDTSLQNHLMSIEDTGYAILDNSQKAAYYTNLRILARQLISLQEYK